MGPERAAAGRSTQPLRAGVDVQSEFVVGGGLWHVFDARRMPPEQKISVRCRDEPGWITFSIDGTLAYTSTGEVIDVKTRKIVAALSDETGREVHSEKMLEIDFVDGQPIRNGDQFGLDKRR